MDGNTTVPLLSFPTIEIFRLHLSEHVSHPFVTDGQYTTTALQWMTSFYSAESIQKFASLAIAPFFTVEEDAIVQKFVGMRNETLVNMLLLALTLGPALSITVLTMMVAVRLRLKYVYLPDLTGYNQYNSEMNLLRCAAYVALKDENEKVLEEDGIVVGVSRFVPHVGPLLQNSKDTNENMGTEFLEEKLE